MLISKTALLAILGVGFLAAAAGAPAGRPPNLVVIVSDDMGYSDLGCFGGEIQTPHLDRLAARGLRFTHFYNTARCCPTRASLLTGLYPHQAGVGHMMEDRQGPGYRGDLRLDRPTIAEVLKPAGYRCYAVGKWHVTRHTRPEAPNHNWPRQRGFDRFYGTLTGAGSFFDPSTLLRDNTMINADADPEYVPKAPYYYTDAIGDHAIRFVRDHVRDHADRPFFLYVAFTAAHWPMQAPDEAIAAYRGRYDAGYEAIRRERWAKMQRLGLLDPAWRLPAPAGDWQAVTNKAWEARCMEVYAAMVTRMDASIGALAGELERLKLSDRTLILYLQDNGGCAEDVGRGPGRARAAGPSLAPLKPEEFQLESRPKQTRDGWPMLGGPQVMPGPRDTFIAYGKGWANVSNTPFREYKHWVHEGGIATPLIAHWPDGIRTRELCEQPGHLIDILATCADLARADYPATFAGSALGPPEGRSLRPAFENRPIAREALYWEHEGNRAVRVGSRKLVAKGPGGAWELYDLAKDRTEQHDLGAAQPERVRELSALWESWARRADVLPWIWRPSYGTR